MHEVQYPDYKLFPAAFEAWLRAKFDDPTITVETEREEKLAVGCPGKDARRYSFVPFATMNTHDQLMQHCSKSLDYPCNLQEPCQPRRTLDGYRKMLIKSEEDLFDSEKEEITIIESGERAYKCDQETFTRPAGLQKHLLQNRFNGFDALDKPADDLVQIPRLGRSGCVHGTQYLLRSVEQSTGPMGETAWNIRQMAVHHHLMQETIKEAMLDDPSLSPTPAEGLSKSFAATLLTHLIHLQWCDESWRLCINDFEERIRTVLSKAKTARVHQQSGIHTTVKRALTSKSNTNVNDKSEKHTAFRNTRLQLNKNGWEALTSYLCLTPITGNTSEPVPREKEMVDEGVSNRLEALMVLDTFSINEAQKLHDIGEHLENFRQIKISCKAELASFSRHVERIRKNLEIRVTQIESLIAWLKEGKVLVSHMFTESSHIQSEKMKKIAYKTEKETISMHVIMCVTLAFLPGTFVAGVHQSGLPREPVFNILSKSAITTTPATGGDTTTAAGDATTVATA
ncbi:hypothetical protein FPSE_01993 [Fusarium pseudograminearum CS3096]|uniref:CorA-like transporter domain-containing protein n=1 Tax=Fusarium pseudograminearum (strain CS3096) TaxID=1028729 RepID=K3W2M3_FUSPC|nr:hypothetical protein FPSE_01993 [Fusarium pseudograminearum CS3096]EKJ77900.1 hypothetical protein FPSE_01993 [Fusarium pseudograminearum CS3096]